MFESKNEEKQNVKPSEKSAHCCDTKSNNLESPLEDETNFLKKINEGLVYTFSKLLNDIALWLFIGLVFAALVQTFISTDFLVIWGSGFLGKVIMLFVGVPMYICATASTPLAAGLIMAGVSPGTALVLLMAGPATNVATIGVISQNINKSVAWIYVTSIAITSLISGFVCDYLIDLWQINVQTQISHSHNMVPLPIQWASLLLLIFSFGISKWNQVKK